MTYVIDNDGRWAEHDPNSPIPFAWSETDLGYQPVVGEIANLCLTQTTRV